MSNCYYDRILHYITLHHIVSYDIMLYYPHSAKGGAVETGCSGLHQIIACFII